MSGELFNLYLHQNYLDFFSEVEDVARASDYLSHADFLTAEWSVSSLLCPCLLVQCSRHGYISAATVSEIGLYNILGRQSAVIVRVHVGEWHGHALHTAVEIACVRP